MQGTLLQLEAPCLGCQGNAALLAGVILKQLGQASAQQTLYLCLEAIQLSLLASNIAGLSVLLRLYTFAVLFLVSVWGPGLGLDSCLFSCALCKQGTRLCADWSRDLKYY